MSNVMMEDYDFEKVSRSKREKGSEPVALEYPFRLFLNDVEIGTILMTPFDLKYFAYGHLISEGILESKEQIKSVEVEENVIYCPSDSFEGLE